MTFPEVSFRVRHDECGVVDLATEVLPETSSALSQTRLAKVKLDECERIELCASVACSKSWYLASNGTLARVHGSAISAPIVGRFVVVETADGLFSIDVLIADRLRLIATEGRLEVRCILKNRPGCGFARHGFAKAFEHAEPFDEASVRIVVNRLDSLDQCAWVVPWERGASAAVCITDHPDFDTLESHRLLVKLFVDNNIRMTKGVFPVSGKMEFDHEPGMDDAAYWDLTDQLFQSGSGIAVHGFNPENKCPPIEECRRRLESLEHFKPKTWIDHGVADYLLSRSATTADGQGLVSVLQQYGVRNYWSYVDLWHNPFSNIDIFYRRGWADLVGDVFHGVRSVDSALSNIKQHAYLWTHGAKNVLGNYGFSALKKRPYSAEAWKAAFDERRSITAIRREDNLGIYGTAGESLHMIGQQTPWVFDSVAANHLSGQLRPPNIDRLCETGGVAILHTYLGAQHDYMRSNCLIRRRSILRIDPRFDQAIRYLAKKQRSDEVVTMSFDQMRRRLEAFRGTFLQRTENGWRAVSSESTETTIASPSAIEFSGEGVGENAGLTHQRNETYFATAPPADAAEFHFQTSIAPHAGRP